MDKNRSDQVAADQNVSAAPAGQNVPLANPAGQSVPLANLAGQSSCGGALGNGLHRHTSNVGVTSTGLKNKGTRTDEGPHRSGRVKKAGAIPGSIACALCSTGDDTSEYSHRSYSRFFFPKQRLEKVLDSCSLNLPHLH